MSDAKAIAGLHSQVAFTEIQDSFWQYLAAGKWFAKRQTAWDVLWMGVRSIHRGRDESWAEYAIIIWIYLLVNFSLGLLWPPHLFSMQIELAFCLHIGDVITPITTTCQLYRGNAESVSKTSFMVRQIIAVATIKSNVA